MRYSLAALALVAAASAAPAAPATAAASDCSASYSGVFEIAVVNVTSSSKRSIEKRVPLMLTLADGILKDAEGRIGYIAANNQFQFDNPVQAGTIYDAGWAVCPNNTLVLGPDAVFQKCLSGTFYNLYDENSAGQCSPVYIEVVSTSGGAVSEASDGQPTATPIPVSQISDGQPQQGTQIITQISDGQIQGPTGVVTEYSDGQPQAPQTTVAPVTQISDGQPQAPVTTAAPVSQISDGQIQAPTAVVTSSYPVVSQISDGQPQVPTNGSTPVYPSATVSPTVSPYTGAAAFPTVRSELFGLAAGVLAIAML